MSKWSKLYEEEIKATTVADYIEEKLRTKNKIISLIKKYAKNSEVMEVGSGTGILALSLGTQGLNVTALDRDNDMLELSKKYFYPEFKKSKITYLCDDILNLKNEKHYDVCYSIGILEHYSDAEIKDLLDAQSAICDTIIFGIPTKYFDEDKKMYGNERYLPLRYWRKLIRQNGYHLIEETSYHYLSLWGRILNVRKYFKPSPVHVFIITKEK